MDTDLFNVHAFTETAFSKKVLFTAGYSFTTLDSDISGYRLYGSTYDPDLAQRLPSPDSFQGVSGGSQLNQHVANLNLMLRLTDHLVLVPALRVEKQDTDSISAYDSPAAPFSSFPYRSVQSSRPPGRFGESRIALYRLDELGLLRPRELARGLRGPGETLGQSRNRRECSPPFHRRRAVLAKILCRRHWYPLKGLNFSAEYYHKIHENDYDHSLDSTPNTLTSIPTPFIRLS